MGRYHLNEANFDLPADLKDRSIQQFVINDNGPSPFTFVISRTDDIDDSSVAAFIDRLETELRKALPKFTLREKREHILDGSPAMELSYSWRNGNSSMQQRQVAVLVQGAVTHRVKALLFTGTCMQSFDDHWNQVFERMLSTVQLRAPLIDAGGLSEAP